MFFQDFYIQEENFKKITLSKTFRKEALKQLGKILKDNLGEIIDLKNVSCGFGVKPLNVVNTQKTKVLYFTIMYISDYGTTCTLYWENLDETGYISCEEEIVPQNIRFWLEGLDVKNIQDDLKKYAYLNRKAFLEGYRFVVEIKQPNIDINVKILFEENLSEQEAERTENLLRKCISNYNTLSQNAEVGFEGLIHSYSLKELKKKDNITFKIDLGSAVDFGMKYLIKTLSDSELKIRKIEIRGV
jgi:hypothetical protein